MNKSKGNSGSNRGKKPFFNPVDPRVDFPKLEIKLLDYWDKKGILKKYLKKNKTSKKYFSFIDGPITANNPMGVHHAWGRTLKDVWPRYKNMKGYKQRFQNGFDCQGLWVEVEVEKELGLKSKKDIENLVKGKKIKSIEKFIDLCKERVYKYADVQTEQSKRLGYFADWDNSYYTLSDNNNYMIWNFLKVCHKHGWVKKGKESVPWCPRCQTAISQHEILTENYSEVVHDSIYFSLPLLERKGEYLLVWTTTPWTLPANIAVAVDKKLDYSLVDVGGIRYWVAKDAVERLFVSKSHKVLKTVKGRKLIGLHYEWAFDNLPAISKVKKEGNPLFRSVIETDDRIMPISTEEGTGMVHTAVSAGTEDFKLGKKLGLPMIPVIDDQAVYIEDLGDFSGKNAKDKPEIILDFLKNQDKQSGTKWVYKVNKYKHRYPRCWRCKAELVWKVTEEWYILMDKPSKTDSRNRTFRERLIDVAKKIEWIPEFGLKRELDWLDNMHDWLISKKNRYWGLALPIYECEHCNNFQVIGSYEELRRKAVFGWEKMNGKSPHKPWIDEVEIKCNRCSKRVNRIDDVGTPWLDASLQNRSLDSLRIGFMH
jgi:isoleucyl-tRNA synthetase